MTYTVTPATNKIHAEMNAALKREQTAHKAYKKASSIPTLHERVAAHAAAQSAINSARHDHALAWAKLENSSLI